MTESNDLKFRWLEQVNRDPRLTETQRRVLIERGLAARADGTNSYPPVARIATNLRLPDGKHRHVSIPTVSTSTTRGVELGYLELTRAANKRARKAAVYRLLLPAVTWDALECDCEGKINTAPDEEKDEPFVRPQARTNVEPFVRPQARTSEAISSSRDGFYFVSGDETSSPLSLVKEPPLPPNAFERWLAAYPRKSDQGGVKRFLEKALESVSFEDLLAATKTYAQSVAGKDQDYIPYARNWLDKEGWRGHVPMSEAKAREIVLQCWRDADTKELAERTGGERCPDLDNRYDSREEYQAAFGEHFREWVKADHERLIARVLQRDADRRRGVNRDIKSGLLVER